jgi:hypothetical protein
MSALEGERSYLIMGMLLLRGPADYITLLPIFDLVGHRLCGGTDKGQGGPVQDYVLGVVPGLFFFLLLIRPGNS